MYTTRDLLRFPTWCVYEVSNNASSCQSFLSWNIFHKCIGQGSISGQFCTARKCATSLSDSCCCRVIIAPWYSTCPGKSHPRRACWSHSQRHSIANTAWSHERADVLQWSCGRSGEWLPGEYRLEKDTQNRKGNMCIYRVDRYTLINTTGAVLKRSARSQVEKLLNFMLVAL